MTSEERIAMDAGQTNLKEFQDVWDMRRIHEWVGAMMAAVNTARSAGEDYFEGHIVANLWAEGFILERVSAGHRTDNYHDCFVLNCKAIGPELDKTHVRLGETLIALAALVADFDPFDYEQGLCYWCEGGWEIVTGPRGGNAKNVHTGAHKPKCPFAMAKEVLGLPL
jgi:hypothetical protein